MLNSHILIIFWLFGCYIIKNKIKNNINILEKDRTKDYVYSFVIFIPIIFMATYRGWFADTTAYILTYRNMPERFNDIKFYMSFIRKDKGFYFLVSMIRCIFGYNHIPYFFIIALFQGISVVIFYHKYSINYLFSIFLFITSAEHINWMFNGVRQFMAVAIILFSIPIIFSLKNKIEEIYNIKEILKILTIIFIIIFASTFHKSALLMIPIIFIVKGDAFNLKSIIFLVLSLIVIFFVSSFTNYLDSSLENTQYANVVSEYQEWNDNGTNPLRVLFYSIPGIIAFIYREKIIELNNPLINFNVNMSIVTIGLYWISMLTSGVFLGRLPIYSSLFNYILLPWEFNNLFDKKMKNKLYLLTIALYLTYYIIIMHFQNNLI